MGLQSPRLPLPRAGPGARAAPLRQGGAPTAAGIRERLNARSLELLRAGRVAHLATADQYARPHIVPIVFAWDELHLYTPIDRKPKSVTDWRELRRVRNIEANGRASVVIDEYAEDWTRLVWVRLDGTAEILTSGAARDRGRQLLEAKYSQYQTLPLGDAPIVRIAIEHVSQWHG